MLSNTRIVHIFCFKIKGKKCTRNKWFKFMCHTHRPRWCWCRWWCWIFECCCFAASEFGSLFIRTYIHSCRIHNRCIHSFIAMWNNWSMNICVCECVAKHRQTNFIHQNFRISAKRIQIKFHGYVLKWACVCAYMDHCLLRACVCVCSARWVTVEVAHQILT